MNAMKIRFILRITIAAAGIFMIAAGLSEGEHMEILEKAVLVCMECIGIG